MIVKDILFVAVFIVDYFAHRNAIIVVLMSVTCDWVDVDYCGRQSIRIKSETIVLLDDFDKSLILVLS